MYKNDLIIVMFTQMEDALKARQGLEIMRGSQVFGLVNAAAVTKDSNGEVTVQQYRQQTIPEPTHQKSVQLLKMVIDIFMHEPSKETVQQLAGAGLDRTFLEEVVADMESSASALFIYSSGDNLVDTQRLLQALNLLRGTLYYTTFPETVKDAILAQKFY